MMFPRNPTKIAPRKPEIISIFVIFFPSFCLSDACPQNMATKTANRAPEILPARLKFPRALATILNAYLFTAFFATSASAVKASASLTAMSARIFLFISTPAVFSPYMNLL